MHAQDPVTVGIGFEAYGVIEILRIGRVNRDCQLVGYVVSVTAGVGIKIAGHLARVRQNRILEFAGQMMLVDD